MPLGSDEPAHGRGGRRASRQRLADTGRLRLPGRAAVRRALHLSALKNPPPARGIGRHDDRLGSAERERPRHRRRGRRRARRRRSRRLEPGPGGFRRRASAFAPSVLRRDKSAFALSARALLSARASAFLSASAPAAWRDASASFASANACASRRGAGLTADAGGATATAADSFEDGGVSTGGGVASALWLTCCTLTRPSRCGTIVQTSTAAAAAVSGTSQRKAGFHQWRRGLGRGERRRPRHRRQHRLAPRAVGCVRFGCRQRAGIQRVVGPGGERVRVEASVRGVARASRGSTGEQPIDRRVPVGLRIRHMSLIILNDRAPIPCGRPVSPTCCRGRSDRHLQTPRRSTPKSARRSNLPRRAAGARPRLESPSGFGRGVATPSLRVRAGCGQSRASVSPCA